MTEVEGANFSRIIFTLMLLMIVPMTFGLSLIGIYFLWKNPVNKVYKNQRQKFFNEINHALDILKIEADNNGDISHHYPNIKFEDASIYANVITEYDGSTLSMKKGIKNFSLKDMEKEYDISFTKTISGDGIYLRVKRVEHVNFSLKDNNDNLYIPNKVNNEDEAIRKISYIKNSSKHQEEIYNEYIKIKSTAP